MTQSRSRWVLLALLAATLFASGCGEGVNDSSDAPVDGSDTATEDSGGVSQSNDSESEDEPPEPEQDDSTEGAIDQPTRQDYVDAVIENLSDAPDEMFDVGCMASRTVDAVTLDALLEAEVEPVEFGEAESMLAIGILPTPEMETGIVAALEACFSSTLFMHDLVNQLALGYPDEVTSCIAESMVDFVNTSLANEFLYGVSDFGPDTINDLTRSGIACGLALAADSPGSSVMWTDGADAFRVGLTQRLSFAAFEGAPALEPEEAECSASALIEVLEPALEESPSTTVGHLATYLGTGSSQAELGLVIDGATALELARANYPCVDHAGVTAQATALGLEAVMDVTDEVRSALDSCFRDSLSEELMVESLRLQYLHGSEVYGQPEFARINEQMFVIGERCGLEAVAASS